MIYDTIIVGGGPAGMAAALYAARQNLKFVLIANQLGGLANFVPTLKTYLGYYYITGFELIEKFKEHLDQYHIQIKNDIVTKIEKKKGIFLVKTTDISYRSKTVIVATGRRFKKLSIPGEDEFKGKGVSDCTACDGPFFKNKIVAVIGGGRTALFGTLLLLENAKKIYLIEKNGAIKTGGGLKKFADAIRKNKKVTIMLNTRPLEIRGDTAVKNLVLDRNGKRQILPVEGVFIEIGYNPNTQMVEKLVRCNDRKEIIIDEECKTSVDGLFAAGDVTSLKEKQVIVSVGEGAKAALSTVVYLEKLGK